MADKNLNSITFPGLLDKYKVAQVADEYSSSSTYAVGDIVNHLGTTYRCTTAITTAENWTVGHWTPVKIAEEVIGLKSALGNKSNLNTDTKTNIVSAINEVNGHFLDGIEEGVSDWLNDHPEATTTVQDGSLTEAKFSNALKIKAIKDYVTPEMFGAVGDGTTDDSTSFISAVNTGKMVFCANNYKITQKIQLKIGICGYGTITFRDNGCFTVSIGTTVSGVTFNTDGKLLDFTDTDVTSVSIPNAHMNVLFKDINIVCESGAGTLFDIKSATHGFFDMVFKNIDITGQCNKCINIFSDANVPTSWITQINFIDCMFGRPLHVCTVTKADRVHFERCTSQADNNNKNNLLYDVNSCRMFTLMNCFDWDFSYSDTTKLYMFTDCLECVWIGNDRSINNFNNTITELLTMFSVLMIGYGYAPMLFNKANILNTTLTTSDETFFENPKNVGTTIMPIRSLASGAYNSVGLRTINSFSSDYGAYSFDLVVNGQGQIKIRVRVPDTNNPDSDGVYRTKWSDWYTFTPDA